MEDLHSILAAHSPKLKTKKDVDTKKDSSGNRPTVSEIPDIFFDEILVKNKLNRIEVLVLMYLYRQVYSKANLYMLYGISQILSHTEIAGRLNVSLDEVYHSLRKLESLGFINTIRSGQYFVRKYFTEENDRLFDHSYDDF